MLPCKKTALATCVCAIVWTTGAFAENFNIPAGDLKSALGAYMSQTGIALIVSEDAVKGARTSGAKGELSDAAALARILTGTGFVPHRDSSGAVAIIRDGRASLDGAQDALSMHMAATAAPTMSGAALETVTVTSSKIGGDVQNIPISITAMSQEQLTATQTAGGPDLVKSVPNLTFTKTNFTGYNIQIRGIGTQAISVTTDPAVAIAFNDTPFIRNHFFEQEFYDVGQVEVLRGPQGTLYGRNATAGVVNVVSAKPTDQYEAMGSVDIGNYNNRRLEGMLNVPIIGDKFDIRAAGEWTKRDGYSFNATTDKPVDGRDLWSGRVTVGGQPIEQLKIYAVWEHFQEDDDRVRSAKQLCKKDPGPDSVDGFNTTNIPEGEGGINLTGLFHAYLSQGCLPASLYSPDSYETPNGLALPIVFADAFLFNSFTQTNNGYLLRQIDPYASKTQSRNLRVIESDLTPTYGAKNDTFELNADYSIAPFLTLTSQTGYNKDQLRSTEDFNRFNTAPGLFAQDVAIDNTGHPVVAPNGIYCDPQLGCSSKLVGEDLSQEHAWQFSQEVRLASNFSGPLNFSAGANYMHYETIEDYYVFINALTATVQKFNSAPAGDYTHYYNSNCTPPVLETEPVPAPLDENGLAIQSNFANCDPASPGTYIDPNPISSLTGAGHNYFRSQNPYRLNSVAGFGEAYYQVTPDLKLTGGLRWTDDSKRFWDIPSWTLLLGGGYPVEGIVNQEWKEWTGRFNANWTPKLDFTDQTMLYASYARGYKGGGANPPGPQPSDSGGGAVLSFTHPATFAPEFVNAYELGTKNTLLDGSMTLDGDVFYYDYKGYQISQIVDRTSVNLNFDAKVKGAEVEATWEPLPGLRFNLAGGLEDSSVDKGQSAIDLIDRTAGHNGWVVAKPLVSGTSNCILPASLMRTIIEKFATTGGFGFFDSVIIGDTCDFAYNPDLTSGQSGVAFLNAFYGTNFDPSIAPNNGEGFTKDLGGNKLPNTPPFTLSVGAQYSMPVSADWAATLRADGYWQGNSFARIFNDVPYDQLRGYTNVNLALILTNQDGWQAMAYMKNVFNTTAITGAFLNSDDTDLTTNVFVTDPRLFGLRITKNW